MQPLDNTLLENVDLLCLDAGNTVIFLDHQAAVEVLASVDLPVDLLTFIAAEGASKRALEHGDARLAKPVDDPKIARTWNVLVRTMLELAGITDPLLSERGVRALWAAHDAFNLWRRVPDGLLDALHALRATGVPVCIVSNAEGTLEDHLRRVGIHGAVDYVIDSACVGVEKPDPKIFDIALKRFGVAPSRTLHVGDMFYFDVLGARAAGVRPALIDPFQFYEGMHGDVPRVESVAALALALAKRRAQE